MTERPAARRKDGAPDDGRVVLEGRALRVGDRLIPLRSAAMHYFRLAPEAWRPALESIAEMGFSLVETYVPWATHETEAGKYDFGARDPRKDLGRFLDLVAELGLYAFVRPGPHINAEMTYFGLPERIIHDKACQARSPRQNPVVLFFPPRMFPVPSYASRPYHEQVGRWFDAVGEVVAPRIHPHGPVVLLQVDNEAAYYFRNGPYCQDYHPDALALWKKQVQKRHDADSLARHYGRSATGEADLVPPSRFDARSTADLGPHVDWARFQEHLLVHAMKKMRARMEEAGLAGVPVVHNLPLGDMGLPLSPPELDRVVDLVGFDYYHAAREHRTIKRRTLYLSGTFDFPYAPELGAGAPPWFTPLSHGDSLFTAMAGAAYGLRGFNLYMAVDRDRWYGAPIDARGVARDEAAGWRGFVRALERTAFHRLDREARVALVLPREYARLSRMTHLLGPISPSTVEAIGGTPVDACRADTLGLAQPVQVEWWNALARVSDALTEAGIPYVYVDSDAPKRRLRGYAAVVSPTFELADPKRWEKLADAARKGAVVCYGPHVPARDELDAPASFEVVEGMRAVDLGSAEAARALVAGLREELSLAAPFPVTPRPLETAVHGDGDGPRVLFVVHPGGRRETARVAVPPGFGVVDAVSHEALPLEGETLVLPMAPRTVRMLELVREAAAEAPESRPPRARARRKRKGSDA